MKTSAGLAIVALTLASSLPARAERPLQLALTMPGAPGAVELAPSAEARQLLRGGRALRKAGLITVAVGLASGAAAGGLFILADQTNRGRVCDIFCEGDRYYLLSGFLAVGSAVTLLTGGTLWLVGQSRVAQARRLGVDLRATSPFLAPVPGGAVAGVRVATF